MADVAYRSHVRIERVKGPVRRAYLPAEQEPVIRRAWRRGGALQGSTGRSRAARYYLGLRCRRGSGLTDRNLRRRAGGASNRCIEWAIGV